MIVTVILNTRTTVDTTKLINKIYKEFGEGDIAICSPYPSIFIEGNAPIRDLHRQYCALILSDAIVYVSTIYSDASPINKIVRSIELMYGNVYTWLVNEINN